MKSFLRVHNGRIVDGRQRPVSLRGVNFGGWLMREAYILHAPNRPERILRLEFTNTLGAKPWQDFDEAFCRNFIRESDVRRVASWGLNCIRVPFHFRAVEDKPFRFQASGLKYLDAVVRWAKKHRLWVILDLHAAPGSQNHDWHSDSSGKAEFWIKKNYWQRAIALWEFLAERYKEEESVAGYDLLNEAVVHDARLLNQFYRETIRRIRAVDQNHILFVEGSRWAQDLSCLDEIKDPNYALSVHTYEPLDFTFNFVPHLKYPLRNRKGGWDKRVSRRLLEGYRKEARRRGVPVYVGEFGVNFRNGLYGEDRWLKDMLECFQELDFHWTYWTYKAVKNAHFPDGVLSYYGNPPWVNRAGPLTGWQNYPACWPKYRKDMIRSWQTPQFRENSFIVERLRHAV